MLITISILTTLIADVEKIFFLAAPVAPPRLNKIMFMILQGIRFKMSVLIVELASRNFGIHLLESLHKVANDVVTGRFENGFQWHFSRSNSGTAPLID